MVILDSIGGKLGKKEKKNRKNIGRNENTRNFKRGF